MMEDMMMEEEGEGTYRHGTRCIICNVGFERKPVLSGGGEVVVDPLPKFTKAFNLFCNKLLKSKAGIIIAQDESSSSVAHGRGISSNWGRDHNNEEDGREDVGGGDFLSEMEGRRRGLLGGAPPPCCSECYEALVGILLLQEIIVKTEESLNIQVSNLKRILSYSKRNNASRRDFQTDNTTTTDFWTRIRFQLISCLSPKKSVGADAAVVSTGNNPPEPELMDWSDDDDLNDEEGGRASPEEYGQLPETTVTNNGNEIMEISKPQSGESATKKTNVKIKQCFVAVERLDLSKIKTEKISGPSTSTATSKGCGRRTLSNPKGSKSLQNLPLRRQVKEKEATAVKQSGHNKNVKKSKDDSDDDFVPPSTEENEEEEESDDENDSDGSGTGTESKTKANFGGGGSGPPAPGPVTKVHSWFRCSLMAGKRKRPPPTCHFLLIGTKYLMFQSTVIEITPGGLKCLESNCSLEEVVGKEYGAFQQLRYHIIDDHDGKEYLTIPRSCPLCLEILSDGAFLKNHLFVEHMPALKMVCESCWRPFPDSGRPFRVKDFTDHTWTHKSEADKVLHAQEEAQRKLLGGKRYYHQLQRQRRLQKAKEAEERGEPKPKKVVRHMPNMFFKLEEGLLLFQTTLIKYTTATTTTSGGLVCFEDGCSMEVEGLGYDSFQAMRYHILDDHLQEEDYCTMPRSCPLCTQHFENSRDFRHHAYSTHSGQVRLVCEGCWKLFPESGGKHYMHFVRTLRDHMWTHKSQKEKLEEIAEQKELKRIGGKLYNHQMRMLRKKQGVTKPQFQSDADKDEAHPAEVQVDCESPTHHDDSNLKRPALQLGSIPRRKVFFQVDTNTLLYLNTIVKYSSTGFQCHEPNCTITFEGLDYDAFLRVKHHVETCHVSQKDYAWLARQCPICLENCGNGRAFRDHFQKAHFRPYTVCPSCWKLYPSGSPRHSLERHQWTHKSEEEKEEARAAGEEPPGVGIEEEEEEKDDPSKTIGRKLNLKELIVTAAAAGTAKLSSESTTKTPFQDRMDPTVFYLVQGGREGLLLCRWGLVSYSPTRLTCQESNCGMSVAGVDSQAFKRMRAHIKATHMEDSSYHRRQCPACELTLEGGGVSFRHHVLRVHSRSTSICEICWKPVAVHAVKLPYRRKAHLWSHKSDAELADLFSRRKVLLKPLFLQLLEAERNGTIEELNRQDGLHKCDTCSKVFDHPHKLNLHKRSHLPVYLRRKFECDYCHIKLLSKVAVQSHISRQHRPDLQTRHRVCHLCGKKFHQRDGEALQAHLRKHRGERPFVCEQCGAGFRRACDLKGHQQARHQQETETGQNSFQCEFCEKSYRKRTSFLAHRRTVHKDKI